jgi:carboxypeptidase C (cathepsin A)
MVAISLFSFSIASFWLLSSQLPFAGAQVPKNPDGVQTIQAPGSNVRIRYKDPEICETTPGVGSYSGYVDLDANTHMYFWFFEARNNPQEAPITLWLTGGPGSDSLLAVFVGKHSLFIPIGL